MAGGRILAQNGLGRRRRRNLLAESIVYSPRMRRPRISTGLLFVALTMLAAAPAASAATAEYFPLPTGIQTSWGISASSDGSVWFPANESAPLNPGIGRLVPAQASPGTSNGVSVFRTPKPAVEGSYPCCANYVRSVAADAARGRVWFVQSEGVVGYAEMSAVSAGTESGMHATRVPHYVDLWDIAVAPTSGLAWFTENSASNVPPYPGDRIASIDAGLGLGQNNSLFGQSGSVVEPEFSLRYDSKPEGITVDGLGKPWFAEASAGLPGYRIATAPATGNEGAYSEYLLTCASAKPPCSGSNTGTGPSDVAVAPDGSVWFTNELNNEIGRLDPSGSSFENFSMASIDAGLAPGVPRRITAAPDGTIWVAESGYYGHTTANALVRIVPSQPAPTATVFHLGGGYAPLGLAADTKGNMWFTTASETSSPTAIGRLAGVVGGAQAASEEKPVSKKPAETPTEKAITPVSVGVAKVGRPIPAGGSVTAEQICIGPPSNPCALVYLLSAGEYVAGFPGTKASIAKRRGVVLGRTAVTLHGGQHRKVTVKLNASAMKQLKRKGKLLVYFTVTEAGGNGTPPKLIQRMKITLRAHR